MQILGGIVWATVRQGRHDQHIFWKEQVAGGGQQNLHNFPEERVELHEG